MHALEEQAKPAGRLVVVLNGNGKAGAAANTSYLLAQKGVPRQSASEGFQANAPGRWSRSFRTQIFFNGRQGALAADAGLRALQLVRRANDPA